MRIILNEYNKPKKDYKKILIQALSMCCWNSLEKTLSMLESGGRTEEMFTEIINEAETFTKDFEIRRILYGLTTLFEESNLLPLVFLYLIP